ncbi:MAG: transposase [Firmicutes bacterium HGW-Firmicutes-15]|nr:MAG: transposase [Firmicutes bacterium HGW-Firmicutes-15]
MDKRIKYDAKTTPQLITWMCRSGLTDQQMCGELHISVATLNNWKKQHPEVLEALKRNKYYTDHLVEDSLLKRALGFRVSEIETVKDALGRIVKTKTLDKEILPDPTSCIFWLKNRQKSKWRDHPDETPTNPDNAIKSFIKALEGQLSSTFESETNE